MESNGTESLCDYTTILANNINELQKCTKDSDWELVLAHLKSFSRHTTKESFRDCVTVDHLQLLTQLLHLAISKIEESDDIGLLIQVIAECFRGLRNSCVGKPNNQDFIANNTSALDDTNVVLPICLSIQHDNDSKCILTAVQFCGNIVVNNKKNQTLLWSKSSHLFKTLLSAKTDNSSGFGNCSAMVIYNILLGCPDLVEHDAELLQALIDQTHQQSEFASYTIDLLLQKEGYLAEVYPQICGDRRFYLLETAHSLLSSTDTPTADDGKLPVSAVVYLSQQLKARSDCILKTVGDYADSLEPLEVSKLLEIIASASGNNPYLEILQKDMSLLIDCIFLLKCIHSIGKSGENSFSTIQRLADLTPAGGSAEIQAHPAFNFKCHLIRLLGNLCWRHPANQDQVRDLDCIPLLLDCCNMDARNPLIIQWVVMAIRNICEAHPANQAVIAAMRRQGTVSSSVLHEMGLTLQDGDDSIRIAPLKR